MSTQTEITIDSLASKGLITSCDNQRYELTEAFAKTIKKINQDVIEDQPVFHDCSKKKELLEVCANDTEFLKKFVAVAQRTEDLPFESQVSIVLILDQFIEPKLEYKGSPEAFLPVRGQHLQTVMKLYSKAVVYTWKHNCDPCDTMRETLSKVFDSQSGDVGLFAVYGPNSAKILHEQFNIEGAPTTLFCVNGTVDSRLIGAKYPPNVESELEMISDQME